MIILTNNKCIPQFAEKCALIERKLVLMKARIAINGFGRIGRLVARALMARDDVDLVAINGPTDKKAAVHLFKYDSVHGIWPGEVMMEDDFIVIDGKRIAYSTGRDPELLPWKDLNIDIVVECTGKFRSREEAAKHLKAGASKVIISAPGKKVDRTIVMGVNEETYNPETDAVLSNASCTTNCLAPMVKVILENFGIVKGMMTTVHAFTNDQKILDAHHKDLRRARTATSSIIPTTTGAATAVGEVIPAVKGKLDGMAVRVPTPNVSMVDLTVEVEKDVDVKTVNDAFKAAANKYLKYTEEELVSIDYNHEDHSAVFDAPLTMVLGNRMVKVVGWYDNEWGYSLRLADLTSYVASFMK